MSIMLDEIETVLNHFQNSTSKMGGTIYKKYYKLKQDLQAQNIESNPIKGSVRAYLDAFNDWDNPILVIMGDLEKKIDLLLCKDSPELNP
jgi:hypothetical protein